MRKHWLKMSAALLLAVTLFVIYAFQPLAIPKRARFQVDWNQVRRLARAQDALLPTQLNALLTAWNKTKECLILADGGFDDHELPTYAYQIVLPDRTIIIDPVVDHATAVALFPTAKGFPEAFTQMQTAMREAAVIALTHEHFDHAAGIPRSPYLAEITDRIVMTREQLSNSRDLDMAGFPSELRQSLAPLEYDRYHLLAPGVVLIKTGGHTPGSQMVFVQLADGREILLVGDLAWHSDNINLPLGHPRFIHWIGREDGARMADLLRFLNDLAQTQPTINQVVAHDGDQMAYYVATGLIGDRFQLKQTQVVPN